MSSIYHVSDGVTMTSEQPHDSVYVNVNDYQTEIVKGQR